MSLVSNGVRDTNHLALVVDVETTGFQAGVDEIVEVGSILFSFDPYSGQILGAVEQYSGLREPRVAIHPFAQDIHGLCLSELKGCQLDEERLRSLFCRANFIIAHNASFDRGFLIRMFPETADMVWLCSMRHVDWIASGCPGRSLEILRSHFGFDREHQHRAGSDAQATLDLLSARDCSGRSFFSHLLVRLPETRAEAHAATQSRRDWTPSRPRAASRYRTTWREEVRETVVGGPVELTITTTRPRRRDPIPATRELIQLLSGIVSDGHVDMDEFRLLDGWLIQNSDFCNEYPFNILVTRLADILADGHIDQTELERLREVILQIIHPQSLGSIDLDRLQQTPLTQPPPTIQFSGKIFVFTGNFDFGEKGDCERATTSRGGVCKKTVTRATDYVVVGAQGSPEWVCGHYGTKIEKAVMNIRSGRPTAVVSEAQWSAALARAPRLNGVIASVYGGN
jgi:DNA polymerase-3 subunit epsilon